MSVAKIHEPFTNTMVSSFFMHLGEVGSHLADTRERFNKAWLLKGSWILAGFMGAPNGHWKLSVQLPDGARAHFADSYTGWHNLGLAPVASSCLPVIPGQLPDGGRRLCNVLQKSKMTL